MSKKYTRQDVAGHRSREDIYIVLKSKVYNVTRFISMHPGGEDAVLQFAGQDVTEAFDEVGHSEDAHKQLEEMLIGFLDKQSTATSESSKPENARVMSQTSNRTYLYLLVSAVSIMIGYGMLYALRC